MKHLHTITALLAVVLLYGCSGPDGSSNRVVTPARIEAVAALGTYLGAKELIKSGHQAELERALVGLQSLKQQPERDWVAVAKALSDAGLTWLETPEGTLAFGIVSSWFDDKYGPKTVLGNEWADAVLDGAVRGISLALGQTSAIRGVEALEPGDALALRAKQTRP